MTVFKLLVLVCSSWSSIDGLSTHRDCEWLNYGLYRTADGCERSGDSQHGNQVHSFSGSRLIEKHRCAEEAVME